MEPSIEIRVGESLVDLRVSRGRLSLVFPDQFLKKERRTWIWKGPLGGVGPAVFKIYRGRSFASAASRSFWTPCAQREYRALLRLQEGGIPCTEPVLWGHAKSKDHGRVQALVTREVPDSWSIRDGFKKHGLPLDARAPVPGVRGCPGDAPKRRPPRSLQLEEPPGQPIPERPAPGPCGGPGPVPPLFAGHRRVPDGLDRPPPLLLPSGRGAGEGCLPAIPAGVRPRSPIGGADHPGIWTGTIPRRSAGPGASGGSSSSTRMILRRLISRRKSPTIRSWPDLLLPKIVARRAGFHESRVGLRPQWNTTDGRTDGHKESRNKGTQETERRGFPLRSNVSWLRNNPSCFPLFLLSLLGCGRSPRYELAPPP